jgi:U1 small nuclear ribonucleoprotein
LYLPSLCQTHLLPPNLLRLFAPRDPLPYIKPTFRDPDLPLKEKARNPPSLGVSATLRLLREERDARELDSAEKEGEQDQKEEQGAEEGETKPVKKEEGEDKEEVTLCRYEASKLRKERKAKEAEELSARMAKECKP